MGIRNTTLAIALSALMLSACASGDLPRITQDTVLLTKSQYAQLLKTAQDAANRQRLQIQALQNELSKAKVHLAQVLARLGFTQKRTRALAPMLGGPQPARLGDVTVIQHATDPGRKIKLTKILKAHSAMVVSLWATWCIPCISDAELAHVRKLKRQLATHGIALVSMAIDDLDKVRNHAKASKWLYPLTFQKDGHLNMVPRSFVEQKGMGLPLFLVISKSGKIHYYRKLKLDDEAVETLVNTAISLPRI